MNQSSSTPPSPPPETDSKEAEEEKVEEKAEEKEEDTAGKRATGPRSGRHPRGRRAAVVVGRATFQLPPVSGQVRHAGWRKTSSSMRQQAGSRASPAQGALYRSVPPRPHSYTFSDMLEAPPGAKAGGRRGGRARSKTAPVASNSPSEYAERFRSRPTTRPRVIHLDPARSGVGVGGSSRGEGPQPPRGMGGFFPPVRHRISANHARARDGESARTLPTARELQLAPLVLTSVADVTPVMNGMSQLSTGSMPLEGHGHSPVLDASARRPIRTPETLPSVTRSLDVNVMRNHDNGGGEDVLEYAALLNGSSEDYDDLTNLPRPKRIFPRKELPWVYRFKVKKGMNELSKIMASKPVQLAGEAEPAEGT